MESVILIILLVIAILIKRDIGNIRYQQQLQKFDIMEIRDKIGKLLVEKGADCQSVPPPIPADYHEQAADRPPIPESDTDEPIAKAENASVIEDEPESVETKAETITDNQTVTDAPYESKTSGTWEKFIGENLFNKIGILILIVGIGFFVKYAIDNNWINETARTALGIFVGLSLWGIAYRIRNSYRNFSSVLAGGGFAVCFVTIAIAFHIYRLFSPAATLAALVVLTAVMISVALRFDRQELAVISIIGGFSAPFIASGNGGSFLFILGYAAILNGAVLAITHFKKWWRLPALACIITYAVCGIGTFTNSFFSDSGWWLAAVVFYFVTFSVPLVTGLKRNHDNGNASASLVITFIVNNVAYLALSSSLTGHIEIITHFKGIAALIGAGINLCIYIWLFRRKESAGEESNGLTGNLLIISVAGFLLSAILIQFSEPSVLIAGAGLEAAGLSRLYSHSGKKTYMVLSLLLGAPLCVLLLHDAVLNTDTLYHYMDGASWSYIITGLAFIAASYAMLRYPHEGNATEILMRLCEMWGGATIAVIGANILFWNLLTPAVAQGLTLSTEALMMLAVAITTFRYRLLSSYLLMPGLSVVLLSTSARPLAGSFTANIPLLIAMILFALLFIRLGVEVYHRHNLDHRYLPAFTIYFNAAIIGCVAACTYHIFRMASLEHLFNAGLSVALTLCAATEMFSGMRYHSKLLRIISLCVFGFVIAKLACYDLWLMAPVGRIIVFILLGVILLAVSFLYQKLREVLLNDDCM